MTGARGSKQLIAVPIMLPKLHNGQQVVKNHPARLKWVVAGRRWRKTSLCLRFAVEGALQGESVLWGAPTYDQCRIGWDELRKACKRAIEEKLVIFNRSILEASFPETGGKIRFRSLDDPDNVRGYTADRVVIDEAPHCKEEAWTEVLRPVISDTLGIAMLVGTPNGRNWFWRELVNAYEGAAEESAGWQIPTKGFKFVDGALTRVPHPLENPDFPEKEAFSMLANMSQAVFRQEFLAEFLEDELGVFGNIGECVLPFEYCDRTNGFTYIAGLDWGKQHDYTAISVVEAETLRTVYAERWNQIDYLFGLERVKALHEKYGFARMVVEANAMGEPMIELMYRSNLPVRAFWTSNTSKLGIIEALSIAFGQKRIGIPNNQELIDELKAFKMFRTPSGLIKYSAPEGYHDDLVMSLAFAWNGLFMPDEDVRVYDERVTISAY